MFIGDKQIKSTEVTTEKTPGGEEILKVTYTDDIVEYFSQLMYKEIATENGVTLDKLREMRVMPVIAILLSVLREWGIKMSELGYISALLNKSLEFNKDSALRELWSKWMPTPIAPDEVDMLTIDRVLRGSNLILHDSNSEQKNK